MSHLGLTAKVDSVEGVHKSEPNEIEKEQEISSLNLWHTMNHISQSQSSARGDPSLTSVVIPHKDEDQGVAYRSLA
jgi:hypothetical protein